MLYTIYYYTIFGCTNRFGYRRYRFPRNAERRKMWESNSGKAGKGFFMQGVHMSCLTEVYNGSTEHYKTAVSVDNVTNCFAQLWNSKRNFFLIIKFSFTNEAFVTTIVRPWKFVPIALREYSSLSNRNIPQAPLINGNFIAIYFFIDFRYCLFFFKWRNQYRKAEIASKFRRTCTAKARQGITCMQRRC